MSEKRMRMRNEEFKILGSMQEIMAETELKDAPQGLTTDELLTRAPFRDRNEVVNTLKFMESKRLVRYNVKDSEDGVGNHNESRSS